MAEISITETGATAQDLIASIVQDVLKQQAILLPTVTDYSALVGKGDKSVSIPKRTQFAAANKAENSALTAQEITFSADKIDLNKHKAIYASLERIGDIQSKVAVEQAIIQEMTAELALQVDKDVLVQLKLASSSAPDHIVARTGSIQADIINARKLLNIQKVPMRDRFLLISPATEAEMLAVADFVRADAYGSAQGLIEGEIGRVYGFTVMLHTEVTGSEFLAYHKSHAGFAQQLTPEYLTDVDLKNVAQEYLLHHLYGTKVLDSGYRGVWYNASGT
jgi:N4-gp56 family major capsid protein